MRTGVERHELDEPHLDVALAAERREVDDLVVVDAALDDGVDLHRVEPGLLGGLDAVEHVGELVTPGHLLELRPVERVEADVDPPRPAVRRCFRHAAQRRPVGGHRHIDPEGGQLGDEHRQVGPDRRLAAGEADPSTPYRSTKILASRSISSNVSTSLRGSHFMPSSGMQYVQRKLQRSVTEIRRSRMTRPKGSTRSLALHGHQPTSIEHGNVTRRAGSRRRRARSAMRRRARWPPAGGSPAHRPA